VLQLDALALQDHTLLMVLLARGMEAAVELLS
jgi:hypothetical protein